MIDWLSFVIPCRHAGQISDGTIINKRADGTTEYEVHKRLQVLGSFDTRVSIRSAHMPGCGLFSHLEISGNLVKFFQGHNLWGSDDLTGLVLEFMRWLCAWDVASGRLGLDPIASDFDDWKAGRYQLTRVDCTVSYRVGESRRDAVSWVRAMNDTAHLAHRGRGCLVDDATLYFGKGSRRWSLKLYAKMLEILAKPAYQPALFPTVNKPGVSAAESGPPSPALVLDRLRRGFSQNTARLAFDAPAPTLESWQRESAVKWAENIVRAELCLRSMELKKRGLDSGADWLHLDPEQELDPSSLARSALGSLTMTTTTTLSGSQLDNCKPRHRIAFSAWQAGLDLSVTMPRASFYRLRSEMLPLGIDIAVRKPRSNVVPMVRILEAVPATVPEFATDTVLFFQPRRVA